MGVERSEKSKLEQSFESSLHAFGLALANLKHEEYLYFWARGNHRESNAKNWKTFFSESFPDAELIKFCIHKKMWDYNFHISRYSVRNKNLLPQTFPKFITY